MFYQETGSLGVPSGCSSCLFGSMIKAHEDVMACPFHLSRSAAREPHTLPTRRKGRRARKGRRTSKTQQRQEESSAPSVKRNGNLIKLGLKPDGRVITQLSFEHGFDLHRSCIDRLSGPTRSLVAGLATHLVTRRRAYCYFCES